MKQLIFGFLAFAAIAATSCSKDNTDKPSGSAPSIQGNWKVSTVVTVEPGVDPATYQGTSEDYYKFGTDGNVAVKVGDYVTTVPYQMVDASHVSIDGDVEEIKELSDHKLVLHSPATDEVPEDMTFTLTR